MASQIIPVKNFCSQSRASEANGMALATIIFYWYYLTGHIRTYLIINSCRETLVLFRKICPVAGKFFSLFSEKLSLVLVNKKLLGSHQKKNRTFGKVFSGSWQRFFRNSATTSRISDRKNQILLARFRVIAILLEFWLTLLALW